MAVIVVTVMVQGPLMPKELKGEFNHKILTINDGIFQAIGVISFGMSPRIPSYFPLSHIPYNPYLT
jgi:hypothetical protein